MFAHVRRGRPGRPGRRRSRTAVAAALAALAGTSLLPDAAAAQDAGSGEAPVRSADRIADRAADEAAGDAVPEAPAGTIVARDVVVAEGETLRDVARRELGRAGYAPQLAEFNRGAENAPLTPGRLVRIPVHVPARGEVALVVFVKGAVTLDGAPLDPAAEIAAGAVLETGDDGFLSLEFSSGSIVNLQPGSRVSLDRLACLEDDDGCLIEIGADRGDVTSEVEARDGQDTEFRVTTPYATAAVRGTAFDAVIDPEALVLGVTEGAVELAAAGTEVAVTEGFGSVTREGEPPGRPRALLPAPVFRNVPARLVPGDVVRWWELADVERWAATLSLDGAGVETVAELDLEPGDRIDLADAAAELEPGDYTLNLRGVDDAGLKGYRAQTRVTLARVDEALAPPEVEVRSEGSEFLVSVVGADEADAPGYEIQIGEDPALDDPLGVDVGPPGTAVFRIDADVVHARARRLVDPVTVSAFGPVGSSDP